MPSTILFQPSMLRNPREELAASNKLHGEVNLRLGRHNLMELDDIRVRYHLHHRDLALNLFHHPNADHLLLAYNFHGDVLAGAQVASEVDFSESAVAEEAAELVAAVENGGGGGGGRGGNGDFFHC